MVVSARGCTRYSIKLIKGYMYFSGAALLRYLCCQWWVPIGADSRELLSVPLCAQKISANTNTQTSSGPPIPPCEHDLG